MTLPVVSAQSLVDDLRARIGGISNAFDMEELVSFVNEGMNEVWKELKGLKRNYFVKSTQATDGTADAYFAALTTTTREFTLPADLREIRSIVVTSPSGYEDVKFTRRSISSDEFIEAEKSATIQGSSSNAGIDEYIYDIINEKTLVLAQFPEAAFVLKIRFVFALPDLVLGDATSLLTAILHPWQYKILDFAAKRAVLSKHNESLTEEWRREWRAAVLSIASGAADRDATAQYVTGFYED
jgi:hypothetical protein